MVKVKAVLVSVWLPAVSEEDHLASLAEMERLASTLGFDIVRTVTQRRRALDAAAVVGGGRLVSLARLTGGTGEIPSGVVRRPTKAKLREQEATHKAAEAAEAAARAAAYAMNPEADAPATADATTPEADVPAAADAHADAEADAPGAADAHADAAAADPTGAGVHEALAHVAGLADSVEADHDEAGDGAPSDPVAEVIIVDNDLSPAQIRNLERATDAEVFDRSAIIIEIFHRHARTREARLQVELARLAYEAPRVRDKPKRGDRQRGGTVGGAGESDLELDRRRIRDRLAAVRRELAALALESGTRRAQRQAENKVALVGYTNAGKSSLMRALTGSDVLVADQLFATLGTTVRLLEGEPPPRVLISDTVGFIKNLPHDLVASFRSTLDEAREAALLLFVVDAADPAWRAQWQVTRDVLEELGVAEASQWLVLNKCDRLTGAQREALAAAHPDAVLLSTRDARDIAALRAALRAHFERDWVAGRFVVPYTRQAMVPEIHRQARVTRETYDAHGAILEVMGDPHALTRLRTQLAAATGRKEGPA